MADDEGKSVTRKHHVSQSRPQKPRSDKGRLVRRQAKQVTPDSCSEGSQSEAGDVTGKPSFDVLEFTPDKPDSDEEADQSGPEEEIYENRLSGWGAIYYYSMIAQLTNSLRSVSYQSRICGPSTPCYDLPEGPCLD